MLPQDRPPQVQTPAVRPLGAPRAWRTLALVAGSLGAVQLELWSCPMAAVLGIPCPGCGLTRAAWALACGEWGRAVALHPLSPVLVPLIAGLALVGCLAPQVRGAPAAVPARAQKLLCGLLLVVLLGVWLARFGGAFGGPVPVQSLLARWGS